MRAFCFFISTVFLIAAGVAIWMHDPAFSIACCAMSGICRLDAQLEELKEEGKKNEC